MSSFVPEHLLEEAWLGGNFLLPVDDKVRIELRQQLESFVHYGAVLVPGKENVRRGLLARIAAIEAYDAVMR